MTYQDVAKQYHIYLDEKNTDSSQLSGLSYLFTGSFFRFAFFYPSNIGCLAAVLDRMSQLVSPNEGSQQEHLDFLQDLSDISSSEQLSEAQSAEQGNADTEDEWNKLKALQPLLQHYAKLKSKVVKPADLEALGCGANLSFEPADNMSDIQSRKDHIGQWLKTIDQDRFDEAAEDCDTKVNSAINAYLELEKLRKDIAYLLARSYKDYVGDENSIQQAPSELLVSAILREHRIQQWARGLSILAAFGLSVSETALSVQGMILLLHPLALSMPALIPILILVSIASYVVHHRFAQKDTETALLEVFSYKPLINENGEQVLVRKIFIDENGKEVSECKKVMMIVMGLCAIATGFTLTAFALHPFILMLGGASVLTYLVVLLGIAAFVANAGVFGISIMEFIREGKLAHYFSNWKAECGKGIRSGLLFSLMEIFKILLAVSVIAVMVSISFGVFHQQGFLLARYVMSANIASIISYVFTVITELVCFVIFDFEKIHELLSGFMQALARVFTIHIPQLFSRLTNVFSLSQRQPITQLRDAPESLVLNRIQRQASFYDNVFYLFNMVCLVVSTIGEVMLFIKGTDTQGIDKITGNSNVSKTITATSAFFDIVPSHAVAVDKYQEQVVVRPLGSTMLAG